MRVNKSGADSVAIAQSLLHCWLGSSSTRKEGVSFNNRGTRMQIAPVRVSMGSIALPETAKSQIIKTGFATDPRELSNF